MAQEQDDDLIWRTAWDWVRREHDRENFGEGSRVEMVAWLLADPAHRKAYDKATPALAARGSGATHHRRRCVEEKPEPGIPRRRSTQRRRRLIVASAPHPAPGVNRFGPESSC
jgi:ferric-dicitrate binding protein FerR (iron transport regulator)